MTQEIASFPDDATLWATTGETLNPAGTLGLHLAGNLQHFIGAAIGQNGYVRDRPLEFSDRTSTRSDIVAKLQTARAVVEQVLSNLSDEDMQQTFPDNRHFGENGTVTEGLLHILAHLNYHLGQINYLRRALVGV